MMCLDVTRCDSTKDCHVIYDWNNLPLRAILRGVPVVHKGVNRYYNIACAFDIETTSIHVGDSHTGFMYQWQFCIGDNVVFGRTWEEWQNLCSRLQDYARGIHFVIYVHNLAFEWQFMHQFHTITSMFARKKRVPLYFRTNGMEFRCSLFLTNMSLRLLTESTPGCMYWKRKDTYDYVKIRTANTALTQEELEYCYCDVRGLCEAIENRMKEDDLAHIPLTSTGYVRRECREAVLKNPDNHKLVQRIALTEETYNLCREAFRGGDTSANALWANMVLEDMESFDMVSSYPAVIVSEKFPMTKFKSAVVDRDKFERYMHKYACLARLTLEGVELIDNKTIPYIDRAHCRGYTGKDKFFNGRLLSANRIEITLTDIDWGIIEKSYTIEKIYIKDFYYARYGYLPDELRQFVIDMFRGKCELKFECQKPDHDPELDELYAKYKNRINAIFGMMVTDIVSPDIIFENELWDEEPYETGKKIESYYKSYKTFLTYQWGVWVTAHARKRLRDGMAVVGNDIVYCDTDSVKTFSGYAEAFKKLSEANIRKLEDCGLDAIVEVAGRKYYLGEWELETKHGGIARFRTCGAKKYCTEYNDGKLEITVAGCNKETGSRYLAAHGGVYGFVPYTKDNDHYLTIPAGPSGRTVSWYDDCPIHEITVDGCKMTTASGIAMQNTSYKLGITGEYLGHIMEVQYDYQTIS